MPTLEEVKDFRYEMFKESMALIEKKGHDYNREQQMGGDTLFNLRVAELLKIVPTAERGILVRLSDKFMRLISLMTPGVDPANTGESVRDTVRDIHNYVDFALQLYEERTREPYGAECCQVAGCEHAKILDPVAEYYRDMNSDAYPDEKIGGSC